MAEQSLKFPLEDQDRYEARVTFQVRNEKPPGLELSASKTRNPDAVEERDDLSEDEEKNFLGDIFGGFRGREAVSYSPPVVTLGQRATLYLPRGIQMNDGVDYERADLGRIGGGAEFATNQGANLGGVMLRGLQDASSSFMEVFDRTLGPDAARYATFRAARALNTEIGQGVQSALKVATNPNSRQLFREVHFREFAFNFRMVPTTKEEAEMVKKMVKFFRTELYPEDSVTINVGGGGGSIPIAYRFPNTFDIRFKHRDQNIIHRLLPCYLRHVSTNYNPTGSGFFSDGNFSEIDINLTFTESRTLTKALVRDGGY